MGQGLETWEVDGLRPLLRPAAWSVVSQRHGRRGGRGNWFLRYCAPTTREFCLLYAADTEVDVEGGLPAVARSREIAAEAMEVSGRALVASCSWAIRRYAVRKRVGKG
jgi:hypothetical protein